MKISLNWLKELIDFDYTPEQLDNALTMLGIEVEGIENPAKKLDGFLIAHVSDCQKHPDADKLSICRVDTGNNELQVICGAPNVATGQKVVLGTSGAVVPSAGFKLEKRKIRGVESNGMICSQSELEVGEDSSGIWILPENAPLGMPIAEYLGIDDVIFEISVTPNRADCLSHIGIAREIAALNGNKIKYPKVNIDKSQRHISDYAMVEIIDTEKCPRYTAKLVLNCKIQESPEWLKKRLQSIGLRPINAAVDVTNLVLMESGQPLHGFDFDKLQGSKIVVRTAEENSKFVTLDDKERTLDSSMLMICDAEKYVAIGGVMGGQNSEITNSTTNILIESAYFKPSSVRKTSKKLSLQSDSSYRFERGVDFDNIDSSCCRAAELIAQLTGGEVCDGIIDIYPKKIEKALVTVRFGRARKIIGIYISDEQILAIIKSLNFEIIESEDDFVKILAPSYRVDISQEIDVIEEIARLYNYDNIKSDFTSRIDFGLQQIKEELTAPEYRNSFRNFFVNKGFAEILTQNQTDPKSIELLGDDAVKLSNPLGEDLSLMRTSLLNSALKVVSHNIRNGSNSLKIFEIGKTFKKTDRKDSFIPGILESENLLIANTGSTLPMQWATTSRNYDFYDLKGFVELFINTYGNENIKFDFKAEHPLFTKNSIGISYKKNRIGHFGEVKKTVLKHYDIEQNVFAAELELAIFYKLAKDNKSYNPISHFPAVQRDLAFLLDHQVSAGDVLNVIRQVNQTLLKEITLFDVYKGNNLEPNSKSLAFSLTFRAQDRTLKENEIDMIINDIISKVETSFSAKLRTI